MGQERFWRRGIAIGETIFPDKDNLRRLGDGDAVKFVVRPGAGCHRIRIQIGKPSLGGGPFGQVLDRAILIKREQVTITNLHQVWHFTRRLHGGDQFGTHLIKGFRLIHPVPLVFEGFVEDRNCLAQIFIAHALIACRVLIILVILIPSDKVLHFGTFRRYGPSRL